MFLLVREYWIKNKKILCGSKQGKGRKRTLCTCSILSIWKAAGLYMVYIYIYYSKKKDGKLQAFHKKPTPLLPWILICSDHGVLLTVSTLTEITDKAHFSSFRALFIHSEKWRSSSGRWATKLCGSAGTGWDRFSRQLPWPSCSASYPAPDLPSCLRMKMRSFCPTRMVKGLNLTGMPRAGTLRSEGRSIPLLFDGLASVARFLISWTNQWVLVR